MRTRVAGAFLFLPLLARIGFDRIAAAAGYPSSKMVPASSALLALLSLKLLDKERKSHIDDFNFDEALGCFAGLNVPPKKSFATDYAYRGRRQQQRALLDGWVRALCPLLFPTGGEFALDFHAIPFRGDPAALENHYLPRRGIAGSSVLTFFAQERNSGCFCYANADILRADQKSEPMSFVDFWRGITGVDPQWLYLDSKVVDYPHLSALNQRKIRFVTIRRRGSAIMRRLDALPRSAWTAAFVDTPKRRHQRIRFVEQSVQLPGYEGSIRQIAVAGLGHPQPTLFLTNEVGETARAIIVRYTGRNRVEDGLGISVNFFHLDCLASEVRLNVDLDAAMTVIANGCYRWLGAQLRGYDKAAPKQLYRRFVETGGIIEIAADRIIIRLDRRSHNPVLKAAALDRDPVPIPWLDNRTIAFEYD